MTESAIETVSLTKFFQGTAKGSRLSYFGRRRPSERVVAVDHVNLKVRKGTLFGVLGPNGAGKTTTIKLLSTLLVPDKGTAFVNGFDVVKNDNDVRASIGVVTGGERGLYWRLSARENLLFFSRLYGVKESEARPRINDLLKLVELQDRADDTVEKYSRGMKQRLHLIKSLVHDPPLLLLDEPTLGLDPNSAVVMREFIKEKLQKEQGKTILLTTHYMEEADQLCDQIAIIDRGKIIVEGTPSILKSEMQKVDLLKINATDVPSGFETKLSAIDGVIDVKIEIIDAVSNLSEIRIQTEDAESALPDISKAIVSSGVKMRVIEEQKPSLEDVFISLTGRKLRD